MKILNVNKYILRQMFVSTIANCTNFYVGVMFSFSTGVLAQLEGSNKIDTSQYSSIGSSGFTLASIGSLLNTFVMDKFGRKVSLTIVYFLYFVGWCILAVSEEYLTFGRIILSLALGMGSSSIVFIIEMCDPKYRGAFTIVSAVFEAIGSMLVNILVFYVSWHVCSLCLCVVSLLLFASFFCVPDSPYWYMLKNDRINAERSLLWARGNDKASVELELNEITLRIQETADREHSIFKLLLSKDVWKPVLLFTFYIVIVLLTGYDMLLPYATQFFAKINCTSVENKIFTIALSAVGLGGSLFSIYIVDKIDRRVLLKSTASSMGILTAMSALVVVFQPIDNVTSSWISLVGVLSSCFLGPISIFCLPWLIMSESLPNEVRGIVFPMLTAEYYVIVYFFVDWFPTALSAVHIAIILGIFSLFFFANTGFVHFFIRETKGISMMGVPH